MLCVLTARLCCCCRCCFWLQEEWLNLRRENQQERLQLLPSADSASWPSPLPRPSGAAAAQGQQQRQQQPGSDGSGQQGAADAGGVSQQAAAAAGAANGVPPAPQQVQKQKQERHRLVVDVVCGGVQAHFDARRMVVVLPDGRAVSPIGQLPCLLLRLPACWIALFVGNLPA